jgi:hypothetical protein
MDDGSRTVLAVRGNLDSAERQVKRALHRELDSPFGEKPSAADIVGIRHMWIETRDVVP